MSPRCVTPTGPPLSTECCRLLCFPKFPAEHSEDHTVVDFGGLLLHFQFPGFSGTWKEVRADQAISTFPVPCFCEGFCCQVEEGEGRPGCSRLPAAFPAAPRTARECYVPGQDRDSSKQCKSSPGHGKAWKDHPPLEAWQSRASPV